MGRLIARAILTGLAMTGIVTVYAGVPANAAQTARAVYASEPYACGVLIPHTGGMLNGTVCTNIFDGQVIGRALYWGGGIVRNPEIALIKCNAAETSCAFVPGSQVADLITPSLPATAGEYYKTCVSFEVQHFPLTTLYYNECTPLAWS